MIAADRDHFLSTRANREHQGETVTLPDGSKVPRLPGYRAAACSTNASSSRLSSAARRDCATVSRCAERMVTPPTPSSRARFP